MDNEGIDGPSYGHVVEAIKVNIGQSGLRKIWDMYDLGWDPSVVSREEYP